jgi:PAP2 superfamily
MAAAAVVSGVDAVGYATRRWMAMVRAGPGDLFLRRRTALSSAAVRGRRRSHRRAFISAGENEQPAPPALPFSEAVLGYRAAPGPIFVSVGHTITAFAMAVCIAHFYPQCWGYLLFLAASIAVSRIILGMHFLSDVVVGALMGIALGYGAVCVCTMAAL